MQTYRHESGRVYMLGCEKPRFRKRFARYTSAAPVYDLPTILKAIADGRNSLLAWLYVILDQGQKPWCWDYSATQTLMVLLNKLYGDKTVLDTSVGPVLTGVFGGNSIDAMITEVQSVYGQPDAKFMGTDPVNAKTNTHKMQWPAGWQAEALKRKGEDSTKLICTNELQLASALIDMGQGDPQHPGTIGVDWQGGGHALCVLEVGSDDGQNLFFAGPNSWSTSFDSGWGSYPGRAGWWKLTAAQVASSFADNGFGAYVLMDAADAGAAPVNVDPGPAPGPRQE